MDDARDVHSCVSGSDWFGETLYDTTRTRMFRAFRDERVFRADREHLLV